MLASSLIHPSLNPFDFLVKSFNKFLFIPFFQLASIKIVTQYCMPTHLRLMCYHHACTDGWRPTANALCPPSFPQSSLQKCAGGKSQLRSKRSLNEPSPEKFLSIGGFFECYTYRVTALGWLKKEEERNKEGRKERTILAFDHFKFVTL